MTKMKPAGVPSLRQIRKTRETRKTGGPFGAARMVRKTAGEKGLVDVQVRDTGVQHGTPRLDDSRSGVAIEESKSQVEQGEVRVRKMLTNVRRSLLKSKSERGTISTGFIDLESGSYEEMNDMEAVAGGIRRELSNAQDPPRKDSAGVPLLDEVVNDMRKTPSPTLAKRSLGLGGERYSLAFSLLPLYGRLHLLHYELHAPSSTSRLATLVVLSTPLPFLTPHFALRLFRLFASFAFAFSSQARVTTTPS